jgi:hypothetical protein
MKAKDLIYELWDSRSGNRLAEFADEKAALEVVRRVLELEGAEAAEHLFLDEEDDAGKLQQSIEGVQLIERALRAE